MKVRAISVLGVAVVLAAGAATAPASASAGPVRAVSLPSDQSANGQWWFKAWQIGKVWDTGAQGQGITVAVIDSGVKADRSELKGVVLPGTGGPTGDGRTDTDTEDGGHGTHMAMLIAGQGGNTDFAGIAPKVKILPVNHYPQNDTAGDIRWAVDHGAKVINMSYAGNGRCRSVDAEAVRYAIGKGAILVAGSGNEGFTPNVPVPPASCPGVVAVGAVDSQLRVWEKSNTAPYMALAAPGVHMVWVDNQGFHGYGDGTSDSTALVSGVMALVWSAHPELSNRQVVARVLATAKDIGPAGRDAESGFGVALPYKAVTADVPADAPNPVFDAAQVGSGTPGVTGTGGTASGSVAPSVGSGSSGSDGSVSPVVWVAAGAAGLLLVGVVVGVAVAASRQGRGPGGPPGAGVPGPGARRQMPPGQSPPG